MTPSRKTKVLIGIMLITIPTIEFGGTFLLSILSGEGPPLTEFQKAMFRAGHAHAGVLLILAIIAQLLADHARLTNALSWATRIGFAAAPILVSAGFFGGGAEMAKPGPLVALLYVGALVLALSTMTLGVGLIRSR